VNEGVVFSVQGPFSTGLPYTACDTAEPLCLLDSNIAAAIRT